MTEETRKRTRKDGQKPATFVNIGSMKTVTDEFPVLKTLESRQVVDEFSDYYISPGGGLQVVEPMYPPAALSRYAIATGILRTCIESMATNIDGNGYTLEFIGEEGKRDTPEAEEEYLRASGVLDHPNGEYSLIELRQRFRKDREALGYGTIEIVRDSNDGFPVLLYHMPAASVRMTRKEETPTKARRYLPRPGASTNMVEVDTKFRRYVQKVNGKLVYFRENGDTRPISPVNGQAMSGAATGAKATDVIMDYIYAPGARYGVPRWIGELRSVLGLQESESTNLSYFKDNGIPAMMIFLLGGKLPPQDQMELKLGFQNNKGSKMQNKILLASVEGDPNTASEEGVVPIPRVQIERMMQERQSDAFFQQYEANSAKKIRGTFRLPSMLVGLTEEVTYAVASASLTVAESQVFGPERGSTDDMFNYQILTFNGEPMKYWRYRSNPPRITDENAVINAMKAFEDVGAMTPNIAIGLANELFDLRIETVAEAWGDMPFVMTLQAGEARLMDPGLVGEGQGTEGVETKGVTAGVTHRIRRRAAGEHKDRKYAGPRVRTRAGLARKGSPSIGTNSRDNQSVALQEVDLK